MNIEIEDTSTGEVVVYDADWPWHGPFWWTQGNGNCDCNRYLFFERAKGYDPDESRCGHGRYRIVAIRVDGQTVYAESEIAKI